MLTNPSAIIVAIENLCDNAHGNSAARGFWSQQDALEALVKNDPELSGYVDQLMTGHRLCLVTTETSEMMEGVRTGNGADQHLPEFRCDEIEAADQLIRIFDLARRRNMRLGLALVAKLEYNLSRPMKHGKLS